jgi:hypothetical protein
VRVRPDAPAFAGTPERFADPANRYFARFATPWRRGAAAVIDWGLCYALFVLVSIPLGMLQTLGTISREAGDLGGVPGHVLQVVAQVLTVVPVVAYWAILLPTSHTFGMRVMDIRFVSTRTGRGPSYVAALVRGVIATVMAAAAYAVYLDRTAYDQGRQLDSTSHLLLDASYVLFGVGCLSALIMLATARHRSLLDRVFGTAVLDELEPTVPHLGPWGPVDAFDTANQRVRARLDA